MSSTPRKRFTIPQEGKRFQRAIASFYLGGTLFSIVATVLYYTFDHGLRDIHMTFLFLPNLLATIIWYVLSLLGYRPCAASRYAFYMASPFHWVYLFLKGVYTMAKTESEWLFVFLIVAAALFVASFVIEIVHVIRRKRQKE